IPFCCRSSCVDSNFTAQCSDGWMCVSQCGNPMPRRRNLARKPTWIDHRNADIMCACQPVHPSGTASDQSGCARLLRAEPPQIEHIVRISIAHPAEVIHRDRPSIEVGGKPVHLILLLVDTSASQGAEDRAAQIKNAE